MQSNLNVGENERAASILGGAALVMFAMFRPNRVTLYAALGGTYLMFRGMGGKCYIYEALGINTARKTQEPGIHVERTITVARPREEVYHYWRDFANLPHFMKHLQSVKVTSPGRSHWVAVGPFGKQIEWDAEIIKDDGNEISWQSLHGSGVDNRGTVLFSEAPGGRGTEIHISLTYISPGGAFSEIIAKLMGEDPEADVREDLREFKAILEAGEIPTIEGQSSGRWKQVKEQREEMHRQKIDVVEEASEESFPASDSPGWIKGGIG